MSQRSDGSIGSLTSGLRVLNCIVAKEGWVGVSALARDLGMDKGHVHRLLGVLRTHGLVEKADDLKRYRASLETVRMARSILRNRSLRETASRHLEALWLDSLEGVQMAGVAGRLIVCLDARLSLASIASAPRATSACAGTQAPIYCTAIGKTIAAYWPQFDLDQLLETSPFPKLTRRTIVERSEFLQALAKVREVGYAINNEENEDGVRAVAAPVFDFDNRVIAGVSVIGPTHTVTPDRLPILAQMVVTTARRISSELGAAV